MPAVCLAGGDQFAVGGGVAAAGWAAACGARPTITVSRPCPHSRCAAFLASIQRHGVDDGVALLDVVDRQLVELVLQQRRGQLRRGVERQHLRALEIGLGLVQFLLGRAVLGHAADFLVDGVDGLAGAIGAGSGIADEDRGVIHPQQRIRRPNRRGRASRGLRCRAATTGRRRRECGSRHSRP